MADINVEALTDAELRTKLLEYGFPVMPITGTTRKVMTKKLKLLMENKSKGNSEGRRSLSQFSSEEDSDTDLVKAKKEAKNRRATMAIPSSMPAPSTKLPIRKSSRRLDHDDVVAPSVEEKEKKTVTSTSSRSKVVMSKVARDEYDTGSDSESEITERVDQFKSPSSFNNHDVNTKRGSPGKSSISSTSFGRYTDNKYSPPKTAVNESSFSRNISYSTNSPGRYTSVNSPASEYAADRLSQIRSRLSLGNSVYDRPSYTSSVENKNIDEDAPETPFLSNFTRRLSQLSSPTRGGDDYKNDIIKEHDTNGASSYSRNYISRAPRSREFARGDYHASQENNRKNNMVSFFLVGVLFLFFIIIAVLYLGIHSGGTMIEYSGHKIPYCVKTDPLAKPGHNCIRSEDAQNAIDVYKILKPELSKRAVANRCFDSSIKPYMTEVEVIHFIKENYAPQENFQIQDNLRNFEVLLFHNPNWDISIVQSSNAENFGDTPAENMEEVMKNRATMTTALILLSPNLPWKCTIYLKLAAIFNTLVFLGGLAGAAWASRHGYRYYKYYTQKQKDEVFFMVERIVDILQSHASEGGDNYLVVNHVRDIILPIQERSSMQRTWNKAVRFIDENDSRIRTETLVVQGEPCYVWRWLGPNLGSSPKNKTWQGQAFETQAGSVNSLPCSPTPCLKVRGMVEEGDRNLLTIREAVLGKCAHQCRILHCAVDIAGKCVYLKCASKDDAATAYRNLHGWWYSGHLVTVKYLRLERYMQRYADSPVSGPPFLKALKPCEDWTS